MEKFEGYQTGVKETIEMRERLQVSLENMVEGEEHSLIEMNGRLREEIGMKMCLCGPMAYVVRENENAEVALSCGGPETAK